MVRRGDLESYLIKRMGGGEDIGIKSLYSDMWIVELRSNTKEITRERSLAYYSPEKVPSEIVEEAVDRIQIAYLLYPETIPKIVENYRHVPKDRQKEFKLYKVTYTVHFALQSISGKFDIPMTTLLTSFVNYVKSGGV